MTPELPRMILLTDRSQLRLGRALVRTVAECAAAGLGAVVVREHDLAPAARHDLLAALARIPALTVISSRIADPVAHGIHLAAGQRAPGGWFGRSCHSRGDVARSAAEGAAWATLSPYALTGSKPGYGPPLPHGAYAGLPLPTFALGGITPANAAAAVAAGAHGVAVMGAVMRAGDPAEVVGSILERLR